MFSDCTPVFISEFTMLKLQTGFTDRLLKGNRFISHCNQAVFLYFQRAFGALCHSTHLYGRRLVLEWANTEDDSLEYIRDKTAQHYHAGIYHCRIPQQLSHSNIKKITF